MQIAELFWTSFKEVAKDVHCEQQWDLLQIRPQDPNKRVHPTQKPAETYTSGLLMNYAKEGDKILRYTLGKWTQ